MSVCSLAIDERAAELFLQKPDGAGKRGLGNVASLGGPREVQFLAEGEEIADLMHLHDGHQDLSFRAKYDRKLLPGGLEATARPQQGNSAFFLLQTQRPRQNRG
jgi:hypothetical protein